MTDKKEPVQADKITIQRHEEVLDPVLRQVDRGVLREHRRVETVASESVADVGHDEVLVECVPIDREVDVAPEPRQEGDTWIIPVVEEVLVVEKRLVVKEEIHLTRRRVTEQIPVSDTVRRQVVEIETESVSGEKRSVALEPDAR